MTDLNYTASGVVWDLDGTLLDSFRLQESVLTEVLLKRKMPIPPHEVFVTNYHGRLRDSIRGITGLEGDQLEEIYEDFIQTEERHYDDPQPLYFQDALDLLVRNHQAGLKQIVISNRPHHNDNRLGSPRNLAQKSPLSGYIEAVVCGDDNEFYKPDARMLDDAENMLGLSRSDLLIIGDQFVDAVLAHNLGVKGVLVARDGKDIPHLERLEDGWRDKVSITSSLKHVSVQLGS